LIPKPLLQYAGIEKQIVLFAFRDLIEIWSAKAYQAMIDLEPDDFSDLAEEVLGNQIQEIKPESEDE